MSDFTRRHFLQVVAAGAATAVVLCGCSSQNNSEPESFGDVTAGNVSSLQSGSVQTVPGAPVFIGRDSNGIYAMTTTCSHAGCDMSSSQPSNTNIMCHCHGSVFDLNGDVLQGPAGSSLTHFAVSVAVDGTITVHGGQKVSASTRTAVA